jgi:fumarate reductase subunit D
MDANDIFTASSSSALMLIMSFPSGRELGSSGKLMQFCTNHIKQDIIIIIIITPTATTTTVHRIKHITASYKCSLLPQVINNKKFWEQLFHPLFQHKVLHRK